MKKNIDAKGMVEDIVGCKWSLRVIDLIQSGVVRPGEMVRSTEGLTTKVLNERLAKMLRYGLLEKVQHPVIPPKVEYRFTKRGDQFVDIVKKINSLQVDIDSNTFSDSEVEDPIADKRSNL